MRAIDLPSRGTKRSPSAQKPFLHPCFDLVRPKSPCLLIGCDLVLERQRNHGVFPSDQQLSLKLERAQTVLARIVVGYFYTRFIAAS
jgi:hypothetical protein